MLSGRMRTDCMGFGVIVKCSLLLSIAAMSQVCAGNVIFKKTRFHCKKKENSNVWVRSLRSEEEKARGKRRICNCVISPWIG